MLKYSWLIALGLVGCVHDPLRLDLEHTGPHASVYDDGTTLRVTGCTDGAAFGCNSPAFGETMTVTTGGVAQDVPQSSEGALDDQLLGLFRDGPFQMTLPRPADGLIQLEVAGAMAEIVLPKAFAVDPVPAQVAHRAMNPVTITHEVLPGATVWALTVTTCGASTRTDLIEEKTAGQVEIAFDHNLSGTCTHEIHIDQRITGGGDLRVDTIRIARVTVTSTP